MKIKAKTIRLYKNPFEEEPKPQMTLLNIYFTDLKGDYFYKWIPRWEDVERIFWKAVVIEEKNNPDGAWNEELKKASEYVPSLKAFKLPVKIEYGGLEELDEEKEGEKYRYKLRVSLLQEDENVNIESIWRGGYETGFSINDCNFKMSSLIRNVSNYLEKVTSSLGINIAFSKYCDEVKFERMVLSIDFFVYIGPKLDRTDYKIFSRELAGAVRSYLRDILLDSKTFKDGFKESN